MVSYLMLHPYSLGLYIKYENLSIDFNRFLIAKTTALLDCCAHYLEEERKEEKSAGVLEMSDMASLKVPKQGKDNRLQMIAIKS